MPTPRARALIGLGTKVTFTQSGFTGEICEPITGLGVERGEIDTTHMGVPTLDQVKANRLKMPSGVAGLTDTSLTMHFDPLKGLPPANLPEETVEFVFPLRRGVESTPAKWAATGFIKTVNLTTPIDGKMTYVVTLGFSGDYSYTKPTLL